ncbi:MAG TPA: putative 2OG-Fe(II) oxygenase [Allosphingosinicella sp.]|jgi:hypothetical protein
MLRLAHAAAERYPDRAALRLSLAQALEGVGRSDEAAQCLLAAAKDFPGNEAVEAALAHLLARTGQFEAALERARQWPESAWAAKLSLKLLMLQGRTREAAAHEAAVASADPADPHLLDLYALELNASPEALLRRCEGALEHRPGACNAIYWKTMALARLGRREDAAALMGLDAFVQIRPLAAPAGFGGDGAFSSALRDEIHRNPTLHSDPMGHASIRGMRTRTFPMPGDRAATALLAAIRNAVADYADGLAGPHPLLDGRPDRASFNAWALIFGSGGRQRIHHHPGAWLTGVYYVSAATRSGGAIRIGPLPERLGIDPPWPVSEVQPEAGTLILFPSYVPHETVPPGDGNERISVAFDVTAAPAATP